SKGGIYCDAHGGGTPATSLELSNIFFGTVGKPPLVTLNDKSLENPGWHKAWLSIDNLTAWDNRYLAVIDVNGPLWSGELKGVGLSGQRLNHRQKFGNTTRVLIHELGFIGPPRELYWYMGAHALDVRSPVEGQYAEWRCVATGKYGTST